MARTWLSIRVDLVDGAHAHELWPRPGRILMARPGLTFRMLADAINDAFARWDRAHLHAFTLADGTRISMRGPWDDLDEEDLDDTRVTLSRLRLGEQFAFEFDLGDSWMHLCTVGERKVDPHEVYGEAPDRPVAYAGWGWIPDQYGRRWDSDDGASPVPPAPDPPLSDLPDLHDTWGGRADSPTPETARDEPESYASILVGPWGDDAATHPGGAGEETWPLELVKSLRGAVARRDLGEVDDLLAGRDVLAVVHTVAPALVDGVEVGHELAFQAVHQALPGLEDRGLLGDDELVEEFRRAMLSEAGDLRPTPVDLGELAFRLEGPTDLAGGVMFEIATGQFWPQDPVGMGGVEEPDGFDDPDAFRMVVGLGPGPGYGDMRDFVGMVTDDDLAERLDRSIEGRGAFRRFRTAVNADEHWRAVWMVLSQERELGRARWWLADAGLRPATAADVLHPE